MRLHAPRQALRLDTLPIPVPQEHEVLVPKALKATRTGGRVVCAGICMSDIPRFPYELLWGERAVSSVANLARADGRL